jgi:hypothetical protein
MKFKLKSDHYLDEVSLVLPKDTIIEAAIVEKAPGRHGKITVKKAGKITLPRPIVDATYPSRPGMPQTATVTELPCNWAGPPSIEMEGLDPEGIAACEKRVETYMSINDLPIVPSDVRQR